MNPFKIEGKKGKFVTSETTTTKTTLVKRGGSRRSSRGGSLSRVSGGRSESSGRSLEGGFGGPEGFVGPVLRERDFRVLPGGPRDFERGHPLVGERLER